MRTQRLAQVASKHYQIIQHGDVNQAIQEVLQEANIDVFGRVDDFGNQVRMDLVFGNNKAPIKDGTKDGIMLGMRVLNSYNKSTSFRLEMFGFRMICQNGMSLGKAMNSIKEVTFHMGAEKSLDTLKETVRRFITKVTQNSDLLQGYIDSCLKDSIKWEEATKILEYLLQHKKHRNAICEMLGIAVVETYNKKTKKRSFSYVLDKPEMASMSRWDFYNAMTDYASHNELGLSVENTVQEAAQKVLKTSFKTFKSQLQPIEVVA